MNGQAMLAHERLVALAAAIKENRPDAAEKIAIALGAQVLDCLFSVAVSLQSIAENTQRDEITGSTTGGGLGEN